MIIVATYTANLASLLTASRSQKSINSIEDLGSQTKIKYGNSDNGMFSFTRFSSRLGKSQCITFQQHCLQVMFFHSGTVANSAPYQFFADSNLTLYQDLKAYMETQNTLVDDSKEGLNKVRKSEAKLYQIPRK